MLRDSNRSRMNGDEFRQIALSFPETVESSHVGHPDFRVRGGKIFATLGYPGADFGVLILTSDEQQEWVGRYPEAFSPVRGGWGRRGSTQVLLRAIDESELKPAMEAAWRRAALKGRASGGGKKKKIK